MSHTKQRVDLDARILAQHDLPAGTQPGCWSMAGTLISPFQRIIQPAPPDTWRNDDERLGLVLVKPTPACAVVVSELPIDFRQRSTGAAGAKRSIDLAATDGQQLFCVIESPFSDARGWGKDNYLVSFDPRAGVWRAWSKGGADGALRTRDLDAGVVAGEAALEVLSCGELVVRCAPDGTPLLVTDATPYHLDDYDRDPEASAARIEANQAADAYQGLPTDVTASWYGEHSGSSWDAFTVGARTFAIDDVAAFAQRRFATAATFLCVWSLHVHPTEPDRLVVVLGVGDGSPVRAKLLLLDARR